jgi:hypothetical protein
MPERGLNEAYGMRETFVGRIGVCFLRRGTSGRKESSGSSPGFAAAVAGI